MASKYKSKSKKGKITLDEFRAWLSGVEEMQPEGWHPSDTQWSTIRNKMDLIDDSEPAQVLTTTPAVVSHNPYQPQHQPAAPQQFPASTMEGTVAPRVQSLQPMGATPGSLKTPDIDSSQGYKSGFE